MKLSKEHSYKLDNKDWGYAISLELLGWHFQMHRASCWRHCAHTPKFKWWHLIRFSAVREIGEGGTRRFWVYPRFGLAFHLDLDRTRFVDPVLHFCSESKRRV